MKFNELMISDDLLRATVDMGFEDLTPIQEQAIPLCLEGKDIIGQSHTGTGKTVAFAIPIIEAIDPENKKPQALILCPTRELAVQVANEFAKLTKYTRGIKSVAVYGGEPISRQIIALRRGAQIIIGTPGRTIDHIEKRRTIKTEEIKIVVLDEADEMLKMGFREDIELILSSVKKDRQTFLFSATMPRPILNITDKFQKSPILVKIQSAVKTADNIKQEYCEMKTSNKVEALSRLHAINQPNRCLIFCNKKVTVDNVNDSLQAKGILSEKIHGDLKQEHRMNVLKKFNNGIIHVLVATDVAARGLDIKNVDLIVNYDVPEKDEYYVHRVGRSGRAGNDGHAITFISAGDKRRLMDIMRYIKKDITNIQIPTMKQVNTKKIESFISEVTEAIKYENLDEYKSIFSKIDTSFSMEDICASLIKKCIEIDDASKEEDINYKRNEFEGSSRQRRRVDSPPSNRTRRPRGKSNKDMARLFINVGGKDHITPSQILGAVTGECQINGQDVGTIDILDNFSFLDVNNDVVDKVLKNLNGKKIQDKRVSIERAKSRK